MWSSPLIARCRCCICKLEWGVCEDEFLVVFAHIISKWALQNMSKNLDLSILSVYIYISTPGIHVHWWNSFWKPVNAWVNYIMIDGSQTWLSVLVIKMYVLWEIILDQEEYIIRVINHKTPPHKSWLWSRSNQSPHADRKLRCTQIWLTIHAFQVASLVIIGIRIGTSLF